MDFRSLPSVEAVLEGETGTLLAKRFPRALVGDAVRAALDELRAAIRDGHPASGEAQQEVRIRAELWLEAAARPGLPRVVNATGIVLHTNLGRAVLGDAAREALIDAATYPSALEFDLRTGQRGHRDDHIRQSLLALTGAADALVVNNNAAALMLAVNTLADRREVIVSRGELIEIGGSFRLPDLLARSGAILREVGTTNRTRVEDIAAAITRRTGLILRAHPSNYRIEGFTERPDLRALAALAREQKIPLLEDLGSGALLDLGAHGLPPEPTVRASIEAGVDLVSFSGDKILGGPQAGLVVGRAELIAAMQKNPLKRALRVDKLILAALRATLVTLRSSDDPIEALPTLRLLAREESELEALARVAIGALEAGLGKDFQLQIVASHAEVGSGAQPMRTIASRAIEVRHASWSAGQTAAWFRAAATPILGRIQDDTFRLELHAVESAEDLLPTHTGLGPYAP
ncbi:MAG: L-seryl-tRNA(Sec) selenium transferase [Deltaproteobacteria bacterium]